MRKRTGYLIQGALPTIAALGLLLLASSGPAFAGFKEHNFHGRYVASYHAFDSSITGTVNEPNPPAIPYAVSGAMFSDGKGNVSGFLNEDYGSPGTGAAATCSISGTYTVGTAPLGPMGGFVTINMTSSCKTVTCSGTTTPSCRDRLSSCSARCRARRVSHSTARRWARRRAVPPSRRQSRRRTGRARIKTFV
jgi:hypothetical protein